MYTLFHGGSFQCAIRTKCELKSFLIHFCLHVFFTNTPRYFSTVKYIFFLDLEEVFLKKIIFSLTKNVRGNQGSFEIFLRNWSAWPSPLNLVFLLMNFPKILCWQKKLWVEFVLLFYRITFVTQKQRSFVCMNFFDLQGWFCGRLSNLEIHRTT